MGIQRESFLPAFKSLLPVSTSSDPIFGKPKKSKGWFWWPLVVAIVVSIWLLWSQPKPDERIEANQVQALERVQELLKVYAKWKRNDYDGNGRRDMPLAPLRVLRETKLVNGRSIDLIDEELAMADLRENVPMALEGYLFTVSHPDMKWPEEKMVFELAILAKPKEPGVSGSCSFFVNTSGEAWFTNVALDQDVPPWPDRRSIDAGVWSPLNLSGVAP